MLEELVQQRAQASGKAVLFFVVFKEEVADSAVVGTAPKLFVHQRLREDRLAAARICRDPEQTISDAICPASIQHVRQGPLAGLLDTIRIDVLESLVCAGLENLMTFAVFIVLVTFLSAGIYRLKETVELITNRSVGGAAGAKFVEIVVIYRQSQVFYSVT
jgi:hypothetical protein